MASWKIALPNPLRIFVLDAKEFILNLKKKRITLSPIIMVQWKMDPELKGNY